MTGKDYPSQTFQSYYSLISNEDNKHQTLLVIGFQSYYSLISNSRLNILMSSSLQFQSYYSLISNHFIVVSMCLLFNFNPIIVLFLTYYYMYIKLDMKFQSYYSLISNLKQHCKCFNGYLISILL